MCCNVVGDAVGVAALLDSDLGVHWDVVAWAVGSVYVADGVRGDVEVGELRRRYVGVDAIYPAKAACEGVAGRRSGEVGLEELSEVDEGLLVVSGDVLNLFKLFAVVGVVAPVVLMDEVKVANEESDGVAERIDVVVDVSEHKFFSG